MARYFYTFMLIALITSCVHTSGGGGKSGPYYWVASYYADEFHGRPTASGETYDMHGMTAAHRELPFGTTLEVTNTVNGRSVVVTVNDRGPFVRGRDLDLSYGAAREIGMVNQGTARVKVRVLTRDLRYAKSVRYGAVGQRGPFTVQVGSFREEKNAERLKAVLSRTYEDVRVSGAIVSGDYYYRVSVGRYDRRENAGDMATRLAAEGYDALIVSIGGDA